MCTSIDLFVQCVHEPDRAHQCVGRSAAACRNHRSGAFEHEPVYLTRRGQTVAAVIDAEDLQRILALAEDMSDILAAEAAREEMRSTSQEPIPWEEVKADLGLS